MQIPGSKGYLQLEIPAKRMRTRGAAIVNDDLYPTKINGNISLHLHYRTTIMVWLKTPYYHTGLCLYALMFFVFF